MIKRNQKRQKLDRDEKTEKKSGNTSKSTYLSSPQPSTSETEDDMNISQFAKNLNEMIEQQKESKIKYEIIIRNLDRMLQQLPESQVEHINYELISVLYKKIRENKDKNITK